MKLIRLKINDPRGFRSLQKGFELNFLREWDFDKADEFHPYILTGPNGSGKSNVLEVLAAIFYHIECTYLNYRPDNFEFDEQENPKGFDPAKSIPNAFELEYFIPTPASFNPDPLQDLAHIKIVKELKKAPQILWENRMDFGSGKEPLLRGKEIKQVLPTYILGYSSGENEILSLPFFKMRFIHYDEYKDFLIKDVDYNTPEGRLLFLDTDFSEAIVLCNFLFPEDQMLKDFEVELGIEKVESFQIIIKHYIAVKKDSDLAQVASKDEENGSLKVDLTHLLSKSVSRNAFSSGFSDAFETEIPGLISKLEKCSTSRHYDYETDCLILDFWVNEETQKAFKFYFDSALNLFQAAQLLLTLNLYSVNEAMKKELHQSSNLYVNETVPILPADERIIRINDFILKKKGVRTPVNIRSLSDGEHQFLHTLGLCQLYRRENCLFLLDEPETHFNPGWRAKFISRLRDSFLVEDTEPILRETLITTHTPFLVSDSKKEYVLLFNKDKKTHQITTQRPEFNTLGASVNKITMEAFGKTETIGGYAQQKLNELRQRFEDGGDKEAIIEETNRVLGDSVEKILFLKKVIDSMETE
jgi:restriction system-associated AAA family ATPase